MSGSVVILGSTGMLGSVVTDYLARDSSLSIIGTVRSAYLLDQCRSRLPGVDWRLFDCCDERTWDALEDVDWIVNAIGITKPLIHDNCPEEVERALQVNSLFPQRLAVWAEQRGSRILQIATDCVFSGAKGRYVETDTHDALDVYGKTKSLGETWYAGTHHLRCSIIGREFKDRKFLVEWFLGQPRDAQVNGYTNHCWNGITTLQFARICHGVITRDLTLPHLQHIVPSDAISKADMLRTFAVAYSRDDVQIRRVEAASVIDRTLDTCDAALNSLLWSSAGYDRPPSVAEMIFEMARYECRLHAQSPIDG